MLKSSIATSRIFPTACGRLRFRFGYGNGCGSRQRHFFGIKQQQNHSFLRGRIRTKEITRWKPSSRTDFSTTNGGDSDSKLENDKLFLDGGENKVEVEPSDVMEDTFAEDHPEIISMNELDTSEKENISPLLEKLRNGEKMVIGFTCTYAGACHTQEEARRQYKIISKKSYYEGVCLVKCPCEKLHLIADNLGWFGEDRNIEEILAKRGDKLRKLRVEDRFDVS
mmetsp:Transcript_1816/g.2336  ORF Transcript_1816/g.2336 Transcript_1816/m.2336 type:complete len:224 (+) Transcript_1816:178-849(+)